MLSAPSAIHRLTFATNISTNQTRQFGYDGDGNLVKKIAPDGKVTVYTGGVYEVELNGTTVTKTTLYYPAAGAMRVIQGGNNNVYYVLNDHLGSASVTLDAGGNVVTNGEQRYYPFGESRITSAALPTDRLFTGQRFMGAELGGLYHYGARFYLPKLGRFISADTIVPGVDSQAYNRYAYVRNNPLRYTDPTGHWPCLLNLSCIIDYWIAPAFGLGPDYGGISTASYYRAEIESAVQAAGIDPIALAAGIAEQSQWCCGLPDWGEVYIQRDQNPSQGIAQITPGEETLHDLFPGDYAPFNNGASIQALAKKMRVAASACEGCSIVDKYIAMAIGQNNYTDYFPVRNGQVNWNKHFSEQKDSTELRLTMRMKFSGSNNWQRFLLKQFTQDLLALQEGGWGGYRDGWELPLDTDDTDYMMCLANGNKDTVCVHP